MPLINPNEVIWDDEAGGSIDESQVVWDEPETDEARFAKLNKKLEDQALFGQRAFEGMTNLGEQSRAYDEKLNKDLEDQALVGQRALDQTLNLGEMSRRYDEEHPTLLRDVTQRLKSKGQVAAHLLTGAVAFPLGLVAGTGALVRGKGAKGFQEAQEKVGKFFTPDETTIGELTPEAQGTLEAVGKVTGALSKGTGAVAAAIGGEDWRAAGEVAGDIALIGMPIMARRVAHQYVGKGLKKNLADLIEKNNKVGLTAEEAGSMAETLINHSQGMKVEATGKPLNLWEKWKAKQGFARMGEELRAAREGGPSEPFSPEFAAEMAGPKRIYGNPAAFSPEDVPAGDIVGPTEPYSPELSRGIRQLRQRPTLPPGGQDFELVGQPFGPPPPTIGSLRGAPPAGETKPPSVISNLRMGAPIATGNPTGTAHFEFEGQTFEVPLPTKMNPIGSRYGTQWAMDQIRTGNARPLGAPKAPEAPRTNDLTQTPPPLLPAPVEAGQPPVAGPVPPIPGRAKPRKKASAKKEAKSLIQFIKNRGGIWDKSAAGEVRALGTKEGRTVGLVRKKTGRTLDELVLLAVEGNWLPKGSTSVELLAALNDEIKGKKATKLDAVMPDDTDALNQYYDFVEPDEIGNIEWDNEINLAPSTTPPPASGAQGGLSARPPAAPPKAGAGQPPPAPGSKSGEPFTLFEPQWKFGKALTGELVREPEIIMTDKISKELGGYYDDKTNKIYVSSRLSQDRIEKVKRHELEHFYQSQKGDLPTSKFISPNESIKGFMEYFTDPKEVSARAVENGEPISEVWNEVFRLREESIKGISPREDRIEVKGIIPIISTKIIPERPIPIKSLGYDQSKMSPKDIKTLEHISKHGDTNWQMRRLSGTLRPSDPKPIFIQKKAIRIELKNNANGIIAADKLKEAGIEAGSFSPYSVDVLITPENIEKLSKILGVKIEKLNQLPNRTTPTLKEPSKSYTSDIKAEAERMGIPHKGEYIVGGKKFADTFTDPLTHGDFSVMAGGDFREALLENRKGFVKSGQLPASALDLAERQKKYKAEPVKNAVKKSAMNAGVLFEPRKEYAALHNELVKQRGYQYDIFTSIEEKKLTLAALTDLKKIEDLLSKERGGETSKTRGKAISTELIQKGFVDYRGRVVKDLNELVSLCQVFRDSRYETSRWIYVKYLDGGKMEIRGHHGVTTRLPGETRVFSQKYFDQARYDLERRKERLGADAYFTLHNHPTGDVDPSPVDEISIQSLGAAYHRNPAEKSLPSLGGMIIIDHEKYAFLLPDPGKPHPQIAYGDISTGKEDPLLRPELNHDLIGAKISSPNDLAAIAKHLEVNKAFDNTVLFLSSKNEIRGIHDVHESVIKRNDFNGYLRNRAREFGATRAVVVTTNASLKGRLIDLYRGGVLLEAMVVSPNEVFSVVEDVPWIGPDPDPNLWMGKPDRAMKVASPVIAFGQADPRHVILNDKLVAQKKVLSNLQRERDNLDAKVKRLDKHIGTLKTEEAKRINTELRRRAKLQLVDRERKIVDLTEKLHVTERAIANLAVGPNTIVKRRQMGEKSENRFAPPVTQREFEVIKDLATRPPMRGSYREWFETAPRMFDHYGKMVKEMFYRPATAARYAAHKETRELFKQIDKKFEKLPKKSSRRIGIYAVSQQTNGMRLLKEAGIDVVPTLTAQETAVYRWARDLLTDTYNRLQAARKTAGQKPFAPVQDYFTFMRNFSFWDRWGLNPATADLNLLPEYEVHLRSTPFRFAKRRVKATYPVEINARFILKNYMKSALTHIHLGPKIAKMRELLGRYEIDKKEFVLRDKNPLAYNQITQWIDFVSGTKPATNLPETVQKVIKALSRNIVASTLAFSVRSALIQPTALLQTWTRLGTRAMLSSVPSMFQPSEWKRAFNASDHLSLRIMDIALERAVEELWGPLSRAKAKTTGWGFALMSALDYVAANYTWLAADWAGKKAGLSGAELTNFADDITIATQGSGAKEDISRIQRTVLGHAAMLFQTFSINQWGFFLRDTLGIKGAEAMSKKEILRRVLYFLVGATIINTVYEDILGMPSPLPTPINSYLRAKDEGKTTTQALLQGAYSLVGMVPGMGGMRFGSSPMGAAADWTINVFKKGAEWGGLKGQYVQPAPEIAMRGMGFPGTSQIFKTVRGVDKGLSLPEALVGTTKSSMPGKARVKRRQPGPIAKFLGIRSAKKATRKRKAW